MNLLSHLSQKSTGYRNKVAFCAAAAVTSFVFVVWFSTLDGRIERSTGELTADNSERDVAAVPFASDELSKQFDTIQGTLNLLRGNAAQPPSLQAESVDTENAEDAGEQTPFSEEPFY